MTSTTTTTTDAIRVYDRALRADKAWRSGTHRLRTPAETVREYGRWMQHMGITRLADVTGLDHIGIPVVTAIRPNARLLATAQGKGIDRDAARASALMECIEGWHAETIDGPLRLESYAGLRRKGATVVDVTRLPRQPYGVLDLEAPRAWIEGWDLIQQRPCLVPFEMVHLPAFYSDNHMVFGTDGNGLASGNHPLEAIVHALCELIERDATMLWSHAETDETRQLDLATVDDPHCRELIARIAAADVHLAVFESTTDVGIASYIALVVERPDPHRWRTMLATYGFGCHLSPAVAFSRAVTEAVQVRATFIAGSRDDMKRELYARLNDRRHHAEMWAETAGRGDGGDGRGARAPGRDFRAARDLATPTFEQDIGVLLAALTRCGVDSAVVVDLTREGIGIPVVKLVVPGLEGTNEHLPGARVAAMLAGAR